MAAIFRSIPRAFRGYLCTSVPLSARRFSKRADENRTLAGKVAVITGSTRGIGFAIARRLAQDGAHVVISSRKQENVDEAVAMLKEEGLSVTGTVCHVGKAEDRQHLVTTILDVNVKSPALLLSKLLPHMENRGGGSVVLVSSEVAYVPSPLVFSVSSSLLSYRLGEPEECAGLVSFLCSSDASYITGENITVAGFSPKL
ncbi:dehydrogenase/reductase SDR family member 4-like isoform X3 [Arvicanthis niloticus]|uniref:dehydrogenase/reductase SDR family member 4-like isoform X3 n=1 Tax=Arvicanthis niloticus TaxID=61156 RepID=UPI00402BA0FB